MPQDHVNDSYKITDIRSSTNRFILICNIVHFIIASCKQCFTYQFNIPMAYKNKKQFLKFPFSICPLQHFADALALK